MASRISGSSPRISMAFTFLFYVQLWIELTLQRKNNLYKLELFSRTIRLNAWVLEPRVIYRFFFLTSLRFINFPSIQLKKNVTNVLVLLGLEECWIEMLGRARELDSSVSTTHQGFSITASNSSSGNLVPSLLSRHLYSYMTYIHTDLHPPPPPEVWEIYSAGKRTHCHLLCFLGQNFWCEQDSSLLKVFCLVIRPFRFGLLRPVSRW